MLLKRNPAGVAWSQLTQRNGVTRTATRLAMDVRTCSHIGTLVLVDIPSIWKQAKRAALLMSRLAAEPR